MKKLLVTAALLAIGLLLLLRPGVNPDAVPTIGEVSDRVMSPFCAGLTLDECPSSQSARLRSTLESMIAQGTTNREIDDWIVDNYGEVALATPRGSLAWGAPVVLGGAGLLLIVSLMGRHHRPGSKARESSTAPLTQEQERLIDEDFGRFARGTE